MARAGGRRRPGDLHSRVALHLNGSALWQWRDATPEQRDDLIAASRGPEAIHAWRGRLLTGEREPLLDALPAVLARLP